MTSNVSDDRARLRRIVRVSRVARIALLAGAFLITVSWIAPALSQAGQVQFIIGPLQITWQIWSPWPALHGALNLIGWSPFVVLVLPRVLVFLAVVFQVLQLFGLYQQGLIFTARHVSCLRRIGNLTVLWGVLLLIYPALVGFMASLFAEGYTGYWFSAGWDPLFYIVGGLALLVMAWVMQEGLQIQAEQELTI